MKQNEFELLDELADAVDEFVQQWLTGAEAKPMLEKIQAGCEQTSMGVGLSVEMHVTENGREDTLRMLTTGMQCYAGQEPYVASGDSSIQRYICDGEICQVPHDQCPNCWSEWDFKYKNQICSACGYQLGNQVKLLLDSDQCPNCNVGTVTVESPVCEQCDSEVDLRTVTWG